MNVVIDTNVLVSAFAIGGKPRQVLDQAVGGDITAYTSQALLTELTEILNRKFGFDDEKIQQIEQLIIESFTIVTPRHIPNVVARDPDDNQVLAVAHEAEINAIISGDKDLLSLGSYKSTPIVNASTFLADNQSP